jgi:hypothetical protein
MGAMGRGTPSIAGCDTIEHALDLDQEQAKMMVAKVTPICRYPRSLRPKFCRICWPMAPTGASFSEPLGHSLSSTTQQQLIEVCVIPGRTLE